MTVETKVVLMPCPDCGRERSPSAKACPGCGAKLIMGPSAGEWVFAVVLTLFVALPLGVLFSPLLGLCFVGLIVFTLATQFKER